MTGLLTLVVAAESERRHEELLAALRGIPVQFVAPSDVLDGPVSAIEDAEGFQATAERRASELCRLTGLITIAETSGLEVDALGGRLGLRPGSVTTERPTDAENNAALLSALEELEDEDRAARFRCVLAVATPWDADVLSTQGCLEGHIARTPRGGGGFGYEPLFVVEAESGHVLAELSDIQRARVSPYAAAARELVPRLVALLNDVLDGTERIAGRTSEG
jgi:XTP/dITP diphosphohydrolase